MIKRKDRRTFAGCRCITVRSLVWIVSIREEEELLVSEMLWVAVINSLWCHLLNMYLWLIKSYLIFDLSYLLFNFNAIELNSKWQNESRIIIILCSYLFSKPCPMQSKSGASQNCLAIQLGILLLNIIAHRFRNASPAQATVSVTLTPPVRQILMKTKSHPWPVVRSMAISFASS